MCGRFCLDSDIETLNQTFKLTQGAILTPRYNIAPGQVVPVIKEWGNLQFLMWGLKPAWLPAGRNPFINARSETLHEKPAFKHAFKTGRCLIIATGYYEWKAIGSTKQPYLFKLPKTQVFAMAGISLGDTCAVLTAKALPELQAFHDRMPVIIPPQFYELWIDPKTSLDKLQICMQNTDLNLKATPVSTKVNNPKNDSIECTLALQQNS